MEKPASPDYPIHELIKQRWSPRAFSDRALAPEILGQLLEAARWAPSSFNEQPWNYLVAFKQYSEDFKKMVECLTERNQRWAQGAPVLMISVTKLNFARTGKPNRHAWHDVGLASASLTLQALSLGIFVHQMAGIQPDKIRAAYNIPPDHEPVAGLALGYPGDPEKLPVEFQEAEKAPRSRRSIGEFAFSQTWGQPIPLKAAVPSV